MDRIAALAIMASIGCTGCATTHYDHTKVGTLGGSLVVEWMEPDKFLFLPKPDHPLVFRRSDQRAIQPGVMYTDGGSIPRPLWALRNYSPWGYGPAFVIHDWLFHMQNCQLPGWNQWTVGEAATVMSEVMKTMMQSPSFHYGDETTVYLMYKAVQTEPARKAWESRDCKQPPSPAADSWRPSARFVVTFDSTTH